MNDHQRIIEVLKRVSEKRLLLIDLTWELVNEKGEMDYQKVADRSQDLNLAVAEAQAYARSTAQAMKALAQLPARPVS